MGKRSFTIVEIIVSLVIIGILATFGVPFYLNIIENSKAKICESNLQALRTALDLYAMEHDKFPASLSMLPHRYIREAYKRRSKEKDFWQVELAYFILRMKQQGVVYASGNFLKDEIAKNNLNIITCPMDHEGLPPASGGYSYGVNASFADMSYADYKALPGDTPLVADCENAVFNGPGEFAYMRHKKYRIYSSMAYPMQYYQAVTKDGTIITNLYP